MQTSSNNFHKICTGTKHVNKANKSGFAILSFSENIYAINNISDQAQNRNKTLTNMQDSCKQVVPLERTFHKEPNKIWFSIFRASHK